MPGPQPCVIARERAAVHSCRPGMPGPYGRAPGSLTATTRSRAAAHSCGPGMPGPYSAEKNFPNPLDTPLFL